MQLINRFLTLNVFLLISTCILGQNPDSIQNVINTTDVDSVKIQAYFELADIYYYDNPDTAAFFYKTGIEIGKSKNLSKIVFNAQVNLFMLYTSQSDYFNAKIIANDALALAGLMKDSMLISQAHSNLGNLYSLIEMYEKALNHFHQAIQVYPIEKNPVEAGKLYGRMGNLYLTMGYYDDAEKAYNRAIEFFKKANVQKGIIVATQNLGIVERHRKNFDKAIEFYNQALKEHEKIGNQAGIAQCMANIGNIYVENNEYYKALTNYHNALKIFIDQNQTIDEVLCYSEIAGLYVKIKKPDLALDYINKSLRLIQTMPENLRTRLAVLYNLQDAYALSGDSANAYKFLDEYQSLNDSLMILDSQKRIDILKTQLEFEQKDKDIQLLTVENKLKETELKRKSIFQIFYLIFIGFAIFAISALFFLFRLKKKANIALEMKNAEILQQKEEIESQRDEIEAQRDMVYSQKLDLEAIHLKISQSIEYAQIIQTSILPDPEILKGSISDYFVFYKPKDIVSGDFYWWAKIENTTVITAVDCTGHGVPGAFMSMLGISFLREIVMKEYITHPGVILRKLRKEIVKSLNQKDELGAPRDGMDMALVSINHNTNIIQFAGAHNPVYIVSSQFQKPEKTLVQEYSIEGADCKLYEIKPDKMPIAIYHKMDPFTNHEIQLHQGDQIYMFSDGFADQFGGLESKRFMYNAFRELILKISDKPMYLQKEIIETTFNIWKEGQEQIDDVVVLGIKI
ncbi:MAG: hypothetical protein A2X13_01435 [Bacteroidetes bacterium GWC2_33_15]|nr:MAG: hypothetical protein A2X10_08190 [Bacteroidetes bacterium GWA2_33_15]OFX52145.1 MAG: hypothetical protein A2X13_01435 [Bacteroidetes bacterium GWC2_33_15]OFX64299.1 MAG: hypothetical protein A2X15_12255 [Bacteroidetes bacterium GWB2_32_14]OFX67704.1 MAG: hypothetical protein A2X14_06080 [Bacteroidetes bacterium GWD2_33_33]HAN19314.1 hypothetical protein [Bacteroidales bacterium]